MAGSPLFFPLPRIPRVTPAELPVNGCSAHQASHSARAATQDSQPLSSFTGSWDSDWTSLKQTDPNEIAYGLPDAYQQMPDICLYGLMRYRSGWLRW